jgi:hypothetical protein
MKIRSTLAFVLLAVSGLASAQAAGDGGFQTYRHAVLGDGNAVVTTPRAAHRDSAEAYRVHVGTVSASLAPAQAVTLSGHEAYRRSVLGENLATADRTVVGTAR